jgi:hypothetical protein
MLGIRTPASRGAQERTGAAHTEGSAHKNTERPNKWASRLWHVLYSDA